MKPLRILQIVPALSLVYGGPSQMVLGLSKALAQAGVAVTILTTDANGDDGQRLDVPIDCPIWQDGYSVRYFRCAHRRYKFSFPLLRWLTSHTNDFDIAHIHALFSPVSSAAASVARHRHLPYILRPLGTLDPADLRKKRRLKQIYAAVWERSNLAGAQALHFTSLQEAQVSERFGATTRDIIIPIGVAPHSASASLMEPLPDSCASIAEQHRPVLLFLSRIDRKKGLDLLIPALEQLLPEIPFHFVLAGANPQDPHYEAQIRAQIRASPLAAHTTMTGFVTGDRKAALLRTASLFVLPSYYENFGIAIAEAMIAGVPVVVSDRVQICDQIAQSQAGWVCACDISALTETLRTALQNPIDRQRRGANAQAYAQTHFGWETIAQQTIGAYEEILGGIRR